MAGTDRLQPGVPDSDRGGVGQAFGQAQTDDCDLAGRSARRFRLPCLSCTLELQQSGWTPKPVRLFVLRPEGGSQDGMSQIFRL